MNDADACAAAEWKFGAGNGTQNMIFLTFGTGLGAGLILNGKLYSGTNGNAGEIGHIRLEGFGPVGYGKAGSFEGFCSGGGLAQLGYIKALEKAQTGVYPLYFKKGMTASDVTAKPVADAADKGDETAKEVYRICGEQLGKGLSVLIDILNPERIVIGSIFARSEGLLREGMERLVNKEALPQSLGFGTSESAPTHPGTTARSNAVTVRTKRGSFPVIRFILWTALQGSSQSIFAVRITCP